MSDVSFARELDSFAGPVKELLTDSLLTPARCLFERPGKMLRGQLVRTGFLLSDTDATFDEVACKCLADTLEAIHTGSMIVDDIQDGSKVRRGLPTLHELYGMPLALNAGNWLYFVPMQWIRALNLTADKELRLYRMYHETLMRGHIGQALDLGTRIDTLDRKAVVDVCKTSLELKTGALVAFALAAGAILAGASDRRINELQEFGLSFGVALQMFDDIGNLSLPAGDLKRHEDLRLRRPTWLWAAAAQSACDDSEYKLFCSAVFELPNENSLISWLERHQMTKHARESARMYLRETCARLEKSLGSSAADSIGLETVSKLARAIEVSYG